MTRSRGRQVRELPGLLTKGDVDRMLERDVRVTHERGGRVSFSVPAEALKAIEAEKYRSQAVSAVPSTPMNMVRTNGVVQQGVTLGNRPTVWQLRWMRNRVPLINAIHAARRVQLQRMSRRWSGKPGDVGWRVVHKDFTDPNHQPPASSLKFIQDFEALMERPSPRYKVRCTADLLVPLGEDALTLNHPVIEKIFHPSDDARVVGFRAVDAGCVMPTLDFLEHWRRTDTTDGLARATDGELADRASASLNLDLHSAEYVFLQQGIARRAYRPGHLLVGTENTRTDVEFAGWPPGRLEEALALLYAFVDTYDFNHAFFKRGFMAKFVLGYTGDAHQDDVAAFINMLGEMTLGVRNAHAVPFLPMGRQGEFHKIDLGATPDDMAFGTWLSMIIALVCAIYRMDPSTINAQPWDAGSGPSLSAPSRGTEIALAKEEGLQGLLQHLSSSMFDELARGCHPDLRVIWEYGDFDPLKAAEVTELRVKTVITSNEARMEEGKDPLGFYLPPEKYKAGSDEERARHDDNENNWIANPTLVQAKIAAREAVAKSAEAELTRAAQKEAAEAAADQPAEPVGITKGDGTTHFVVRDLERT